MYKLSVFRPMQSTETSAYKLEEEEKSDVADGAAKSVYKTKLK